MLIFALKCRFFKGSFSEKWNARLHSIDSHFRLIKEDIIGGTYNPCRLYEKCVQNLFCKTWSLPRSKHKTVDNIKMYFKEGFPRWKIFSSLVFEVSRIALHNGSNEQIQKYQRIFHWSFLMKILCLNYVHKMTLNWKVVLGPKLLKGFRVSWSFCSVSVQDSKFYVSFLAGFISYFAIGPKCTKCAERTGVGLFGVYNFVGNIF